MNKNANLFVAVIVSILFVIAWDYFVTSRYASPTKRTPPSASPKTDISTAATSTGDRSAAVFGSKELPKDQRSAETIVLMNENAEIKLSGRGGAATSWRIKEKNHLVELIGPVPTEDEWPLSTWPELVFNAHRDSEKSASFVAEHPQGFRILKKITLAPSGSLHELTVSVSNPTSNTIQTTGELIWTDGLDKYLQTVTDTKAARIRAKEDTALSSEMRALGFAEQLRVWKPGLVFGREIAGPQKGPFKWVGIDNSHFLAALLPVEGTIDNITVKTDRNTPPSIAIPLQLALAPGETKTLRFELYVGPKQYDDLKKLQRNLEKSVDFGFFGVIAKALLKTLHFFERLTGNYGWAIILLTILIQILVFPLTRKNLEHSLRMKELSPQIKKLQEQYKSDPKRLQIETLNLYRRKGMKFMGMEGCFPMLLQIPIFLAFYTTLRVAYELRGAPWIFWIKDLGTYDPYYVLPILMGLGMLAQQKLTTVPADPAQAKMMLLMPIMFTFFFIKLPAGLVLYWFVNSIATILIQKIMTLKQSHTPAPA